jgi:hypothetical protein
MDLSWTLLESDVWVGGGKKQSDWPFIQEIVHRILSNKGTATLELKNTESLIRSLQVRAEDGQFVVMYGVETEKDWVVHSFQNSSIDAEKIFILGNLWSAHQVCKDKSLVLAVFEEFFFLGRVLEKS